MRVIQPFFVIKLIRFLCQPILRAKLIILIQVQSGSMGMCDSKSSTGRHQHQDCAPTQQRQQPCNPSETKINPTLQSTNYDSTKTLIKENYHQKQEVLKKPSSQPDSLRATKPQDVPEGLFNSAIDQEEKADRRVQNNMKDSGESREDRNSEAPGQEQEEEQQEGSGSRVLQKRDSMHYNSIRVNYTPITDDKDYLNGDIMKKTPFYKAPVPSQVQRRSRK